jgi:hypothetical protein
LPNKPKSKCDLVSFIARPRLCPHCVQSKSIYLLQQHHKVSIFLFKVLNVATSSGGYALSTTSFASCVPYYMLINFPLLEEMPLFLRVLILKDIFYFIKEFVS